MVHRGIGEYLSGSLPDICAAASGHSRGGVSGDDGAETCPSGGEECGAGEDASVPVLPRDRGILSRA